MRSYFGSVAVDEVIVEPLVITVIESLLLQFPLSIPVCLGDKLRNAFVDGGNQGGPVLGCGFESGAAIPGALKNRVQEEHRHVAANAIARDASPSGPPKR